MQKIVSSFARFGPLDRYSSMETKNTSKIQSTQRAAKSFLNKLREDPEFHVGAKRIGLIGLVALFLGTGMFFLARSGVIYDANTLEVVVFTALVATMVLVSAVICLAIRVMDELLSYIVDRVE